MVEWWWLVIAFVVVVGYYCLPYIIETIDDLV